MTEDEAKTKWCPHVRTKTTAFGLDNSGPAGVNRDFDGVPIDRLHTCIASACMAWRAIPPPDLSRAKIEWAADRKINAIKALREAYPSFGLKEAKDVIDGTRPWPEIDAGGYCGLAGAQP